MAILNVAEIIGKPSAILHSDGLLLYENMKHRAKDNFTISFKGISHCTTAFLNASIGKFLIENPDKETLINFDLANEPHIEQKLDLVLENARNEKKRAQMDESSRKIFYA
jgi:hypothetical protein